MPQKATVYLKSISRLSQSRFHNEPKKERESAAQYEERTWKSRMHVNGDGRVFIPADALKRALITTAKFLGESIPGKGKSTYTKRFMAGILINENVLLSQTKDDLEGEWVHVPSDGISGGSKRVLKCFPYIDEWEGVLQVHVFDDLITKEVFERHLKNAGMFNGVGRYRPQVGGIFGRFEITKIVWEDCEF